MRMIEREALEMWLSCHTTKKDHFSFDLGAFVTVGAGCYSFHVMGQYSASCFFYVLGGMLSLGILGHDELRQFPWSRCLLF